MSNIKLKKIFKTVCIASDHAGYKLKEDIKNKAVNIIGQFFGDVLLAFGGLLLTTTFIGTAAKALLGNTAIQAIFGLGKPFQGPMPLGAKLPLGLSPALATAGIVSLLAYGITTTFSNFSNALEETLKENNNEFEIKSFLANFFGGNDEGGFMNALKQAFLVGGTGILAGVATKGIIASFVGLGAVGGPPGIILGGLIGLAVAGVVGLITGLIGSDKLEAGFKRIGEDFNNTVNIFSHQCEDKKRSIVSVLN